MEVLSKKHIQDMVVVNSRWPLDIVDFPLQSLDSQGLGVLRLCFFGISYIWLPTHYSNLVALDLTCCSISKRDLRALDKPCRNLKKLYIGL